MKYVKLIKKDKKTKKLKTDAITAVPVFDVGIEKAVLYCLAHNRDIQNQIYKLDESDFYSLDTRRIFVLFKKIIDRDYVLDPAIIPREHIDGTLTEILTYDALISNWDTYFRRLKELSSLRKIQNVCYEATVLTEERKTVASIKNYLISQVLAIRDGEDTHTETDIVDDEFSEIVVDESLIAVKTGFPKLDMYCKGFLRSSFNIIASYPSAGKTTFILNMIDHICRIQKKSVLFVSLEMDYVELHAKLVSLLSKVPFEKIIFGSPDENEWRAINNARAKISEWALYRMGEEEVTPVDIELKLKEVKANVVFIDYLQLMNSTTPGETFRETVTNLSRELKQVARRTKVPIVAVSAINRNYATRPDKKPRLSDLRETSQIEFDAGLVLMLHRECLFRDADISSGEDPEVFEKKAQVLIAKNRFGRDNIEIDFYFDGNIGLFREVGDGGDTI